MYSLGYLEETILLLVLAMDEDAYGYSVSEAYREHIRDLIIAEKRRMLAGE